ncbi:hypothetical protein CVT25_003404 [Psilocybe cyanescens]|uniref:G-protein coupled receptors family 2 profile 2 domain-containing protein n=1 Tax=Psilocybe cyanescens TaxID=93625 RepID=A0A409WM08_PSICY|nr:hypothetical protein CVT25_003404 [Psilocybe cyanescens]
MSAVNGTNSTLNNDLPVNIVRGTHSQLVLFLVLNMWPSHFGLLVLVGIVILSKRVTRHPTFVNLCVVFIITGLSSSLLVYAGKTTGPEPSRILCLLQASLLYGMPGLTSTAALMLVLQMFFTVRASSQGLPNNDEDHFFRLWGMLAAPYLAYLVGILATAAVGAANPEHVSRNRRFFYCSVESLPLTNTLTVASAIILFTALVAVVWTMVILYRRLSRSKQERSQWTMDLSLPIRIMGFGVYIIIAMSLSLLSVKSPSSPVPDLVIASAATVVILIFGTQRDILGVLCFWKRPSPQENQIRVDLKMEFDREVDIPPKVPEKDHRNYQV